MSAITEEFNWLLSHPEITDQYAGEYIAIIGEAVVAHGKNLKAVLREARKLGRPLIHKVRTTDKELIV